MFRYFYFIQQERQIFEQDKTFFDHRIKSKKRVQYLQKALSRAENRLSGAILLEKHERACSLNQRLEDIKNTLKNQVELHLFDKQQLQGIFYSNPDEVESLKTKLIFKEELEEAFSSPNNAQKRILGWHEKLVSSEIKLVKALRSLEREKDLSLMHERNSDTYSKRIEILEDSLLQSQNSHDEDLLDWETQQSDFEKTIAQYEEERDRLYLTTTSAEVYPLNVVERLPSR